MKYVLKASELRVGNWVYLNGMNVQIDDIVTSRPSYISKCSPIPLTHEILEKAGFKENKTERRYEIGFDGHKLLAHWNSLIGGVHAFGIEHLHDEGNCYNFCWNLKHLHQLQNLYFALTGEELKIEEQKLERSVATKDQSR